MRKKKPIVALNTNQKYVSGRIVSDELNKELAKLAKKLK